MHRRGFLKNILCLAGGLAAMPLARQAQANLSEAHATGGIRRLYDDMGEAPHLDDIQMLKNIARARSSVYQISGPTPLEQYSRPGGGILLVKREDLSPIHAYKWRGAFNCIALQSSEVLARGVVTASAGNHAQGVALAAARLGVQAHIFMPVGVEPLKASEVTRLGGKAVKIILTGQTFDETSTAASAYAREHGMLFVPPYDHPLVIAGQGTIGDELLANPTLPDVVFLQIGGGGLAAGVSLLLKSCAPRMRIVGVEGEGQASMQAAVKAGKPVTLPNVDHFCDGTAVKRAGDHTFALCRRHIDSFMTVTNNEVCSAMQKLWELNRILPEPSGAMGMAAFLKLENELRGKNAAVIISGANLNFKRLGSIAERA